MTAVGWDGAHVLVTGASRGIGRAVAKAAAQKGARLGLVARHETELRAVLDEIGGRGAIAVADVSVREQAERAVSQIEADLGSIDIVVANAGVGCYGAFIDSDPVVFERLLKVNVLGTMYVLRAALPAMVERRHGQLVVIGSVAGRMAAPFESVYSATKFAEVGLAEALAVELSAFGIQVAMVNPGPVDTGFFEARGHAYTRTVPKKASPQRVAEAVIGAVDRSRLEQFVPRWLRATLILRHLAPQLYEVGIRRSFKTELAELEQSR